MQIMHGSVRLPGLELSGADVVPERYREPKGFTLSVQLARTEEAERIFRELAAGGQVLVPPP